MYIVLILLVYACFEKRCKVFGNCHINKSGFCCSIGTYALRYMYLTSYEYIYCICVLKIHVLEKLCFYSDLCIKHYMVIKVRKVHVTCG